MFLSVALSCFIVLSPAVSVAAAVEIMLDATNAAVVVTAGRRATDAQTPAAAAIVESRAQLIADVQRRSSRPGWGLGQPQQGQQPHPHPHPHQPPPSPPPPVVAIHLELTDVIGDQREISSPGSFSVAVSTAAGVGGTDTITVAATDAAGLRAGCGRLQRELRIDPGSVRLPRDFSCVVDAADALWEMRGHQFTAAHYGSMFRTWSEFTQYAKDQQLFGTNQIELAHFGGHLPNDHNPSRGAGIIIPQLVNYSAALAALDLNVSFWWSLDIWTNGKNDTATAWQRMPRVDSIFFPGGDGGSLVWPEIEAAAAVLHRYHPNATVWVSAQEMNATALESFFKRIDSPSVRRYLNGVVIGPHWSISTAEIVERLPDKYPLRLYPDICHSRSAQFAIPDWHWKWQYTHGRQAVNPMPRMMEHIVRNRAQIGKFRGVGAYSEGVQDDFNKAIWSGIAQDPSTTAEAIARQYCRVHFGASLEDSMTEALFGLEADWMDTNNHASRSGDIGTVMATLERLQDAERRATPEQIETNWRLLMYLFRGYYDAYVAARHDAEQLCEDRAKEALFTNASRTIQTSISEALPLFERCNQPHIMDPVTRSWRARAIELAEMINSTVGANVVQSQASDLNLAAIDTPLNDATFYHKQLQQLLSSHAANTSALHMAVRQLLFWQDPGPGGYYDALGAGFSHVRPAHLVTAPGWAQSPDYYHTPLATAEHPKHDATKSGVRLEWTGYAMSEYDAPLQLYYDDLQDAVQYVCCKA
jgi:hypothetical protein